MLFREKKMNLNNQQRAYLRNSSILSDDHDFVSHGSTTTTDSPFEHSSSEVDSYVELYKYFMNLAVLISKKKKNKKHQVKLFKKHLFES